MFNAISSDAERQLFWLLLPRFRMRKQVLWEKMAAHWNYLLDQSLLGQPPKDINFKTAYHLRKHWQDSQRAADG